MAKRFDRTGWAMSQPDLSPPQKFVLVVLADAAAEHDGTCFLSHSTIAERTSHGVTTVRDALRELVDRGTVTVVPRFRDNGKQTSNLYRLGCYDEDGLRVSGADTQPGADTTPVESRQDNRTSTTNSRKNNSSTMSKSRSSRRASARRRDDDGWADPSRAVFDKPEPDEDDDFDAPKAKHGHDSAWGLNKHYRDSVRVAGNGFLGNTNDKAMMGFFAYAKRQGVKPDVLRQMVDAFVTDERLFTRATGGARWRVFIANAEMLRQRVVPAATYRAGSFEDVPELSGSIPQHILDKILAEAG